MSPGPLRCSDPRLRQRRVGFTLVELLIVIAIIGTLAALGMGAVGVARRKAAEAEAKTDIEAISNGLQLYFQDYNYYPGAKDEGDANTNSFPTLYENLAGEKPPEGRGGLNAPYAEFSFEKLVVEDDEDEEGRKTYRPAIKDERLDADVDKYYSDPWGQVYRYRENKSKRKRQDYMIQRHRFDLWSCGPDEADDSKYGETEEENDDIGNW